MCIRFVFAKSVTCSVNTYTLTPLPSLFQNELKTISLEKLTACDQVLSKNSTKNAQ